MAIVCNERKCPTCGGVHHYEYNCRTGEEDGLCERCGFVRIVKMKRDEQDYIIRDDVEYPLDGSVVLGVKSDTHLIWELPIVREIPEEEIKLFLNAYTFKEQKHIPEWVKPVVQLKGFRSIFHKGEDGKITQLMYIGNWFRFEVDVVGVLHFFLENAEWDIREEPGNGVLSLMMDGNIKSYLYIGNKSKEEAIKIWNEIRNDRSPSMDGSDDYLTFRDHETGKLTCLFGTMPPSFEDDYGKNKEDQQNEKKPLS